jgi:hypothetical protein
LLFAVASLLVGCGEGAQTDAEKSSDAEVLNAALGQELELLHAYTRAVPRLRGESQAVARRFRAQQQEYADAILKALRGLGAEDEAEPTLAEWDDEPQADLLARLYRLEGEVLIGHLDAAPVLYTAAPSALTASLAASHTAHRVVLRRLLDVPTFELAPEAFDSGEEPLPPAGR